MGGSAFSGEDEEEDGVSDEETDHGSEAEEEQEEEEPKLEAWEEGAAAEACRKALSEAILTGDAAALQRALAEAQRLGLHGREARRAKDALLALETSDFRRRTGLVVDEAVESGDWWKLQAAMQLVVGGGCDPEQVKRLKDAMRDQKKRQDAVRELRKAGAARDAARLRTAIEAALLIHAGADDVKKAREALKALEQRPSLRERLEKATAAATAAAGASAPGSEEIEALGEAVKAARRGGLHERGPELLAVDPEEARALAAAEELLRSAAAEDVRSALREGDVEGAERAIEQAKTCGVDAKELAGLGERLEGLRRQQRHGELLRAALQKGTKEALTEAVASVERQGLGSGGDGEGEGAIVEKLREAKAALRAMEALEQEGAARAKAAQELAAAMQTEDLARLAQAIAAAEASGLGVAPAAPAAGAAGAAAACSVLGPAKERLRHLQARTSALRELHAAQQSGDVYKLRAAVATAKTAGLSEAELHSGKEALRIRESMAKARKALDAAVAQRDGETLRRALEEARQLPFPRQDLARAEAELQALGRSRIGDELREAIEAGDEEQLRELAATAAAAGVAGPVVSQAWEKLREMEAQAWLRRQLADAAGRGDALRLQAAIRQAELGGLSGAVLDHARERLSALSTKLRALQELQLARSGGNPYAIQTALRGCEQAGVSKEEIDSAINHHGAGGAGGAEGCAAPDTQLTAPATNPQSLHTVMSVGTNPQLSSTATAPQTHFGSQMTVAMSSVVTEVQQHSGVWDTGGASTPFGPQPGMLRNRLWSTPLQQPRPDEPPPSMMSMVVGAPVGGRPSGRLQL